LEQAAVGLSWRYQSKYSLKSSGFGLPLSNETLQLLHPGVVVSEKQEILNLSEEHRWFCDNCICRTL